MARFMVAVQRICSRPKTAMVTGTADMRTSMLSPPRSIRWKPTSNCRRCLMQRAYSSATSSRSSGWTLESHPWPRSSSALRSVQRMRAAATHVMRPVSSMSSLTTSSSASSRARCCDRNSCTLASVRLTASRRLEPPLGSTSCLTAFRLASMSAMRLRPSVSSPARVPSSISPASARPVPCSFGQTHRTPAAQRPAKVSSAPMTSTSFGRSCSSPGITTAPRKRRSPGADGPRAGLLGRCRWRGQAWP